MQPLARAWRIRKSPIDFEQVLRGSAAIQTPKQNRCCGLEDERRSVVQCVRKPHVSSIFAQAHGEGKSSIRMKFDDKIRRAPPASQAGIDALENPLTAGDEFGFEPCGAANGAPRSRFA